MIEIEHIIDASTNYKILNGIKKYCSFIIHSFLLNPNCVTIWQTFYLRSHVSYV